MTLTPAARLQRYEHCHCSPSSHVQYTLCHACRQGSNASGIQFHDITITPADLMDIPEEQRMALLSLVKSGRMTVEEALQQVRFHPSSDHIPLILLMWLYAQVADHKKRANCVIA